MWPSVARGLTIYYKQEALQRIGLKNFSETVRETVNGCSTSEGTLSEKSSHCAVQVGKHSES